VQRHGIGRRLQRPSSGSTPHDRVTIPQICSARSLALDRPRQSALKYPTVASISPTVRHVRRDPPPINKSLHRRTTCWIGSIHISQLTRGTQIPIAPAARPYVPPARFPPLEAFRRRPPNSRCRPSCGRHPKPFTRAAIPGMLVFEPPQKTRKMSFGSRPCSSPCKRQENTRSSAPSSSTICAFPLCQHSVNHRGTALLSTFARCRALLSLLSQRLHQLGFHPRSTREVDKPVATPKLL